MDCSFPRFINGLKRISKSDGGVLDHILKHANKDLKNAIEKGVKIKSYNYDWTLNDVTDN